MGNAWLKQLRCSPIREYRCIRVLLGTVWYTQIMCLPIREMGILIRNYCIDGNIVFYLCIILIAVGELNYFKCKEAGCLRGKFCK